MPSVEPFCPSTSTSSMVTPLMPPSTEIAQYELTLIRHCLRVTLLLEIRTVPETSRPWMTCPSDEVVTDPDAVSATDCRTGWPSFAPPPRGPVQDRVSPLTVGLLATLGQSLSRGAPVSGTQLGQDVVPASP